jgi:hypothetical protein
MSNVKYNLVKADETANITVVVGDEFKVADSSHPNFNEIVRLAVENDPTVIDMFDVAEAANRIFQRISERVTVSGDTLFFDGEPVDNSMANLAMRFMREGSDFEPIVLFMENLAQNPNEHSRQMLFDWLRVHDFTINDKGNIVAYKGVALDDSEDGVFRSISSGTAISDGVEHKGAIPQRIGSVVEMPRNSVEHDPYNGCSYGLHAGTWSYASGFARGAVLEVEIHPRDVVSVPTDCGAQKLRTCRYTVLSVTEQENTTALHGAEYVASNYDWSSEFSEPDDMGYEDDYDEDEDYDGYDYY